MALIVSVYPREKGYQIEGTFESNLTEVPDVLEFVPFMDSMTAAEAVEYYMLDKHNMVASWLWGMNLGITLMGQFVTAGEGRQKSYKEVAYSNAHLFDI